MNIPSIHKDKVLTKNSLILRLNSFDLAMKVERLLNGIIFKERELKSCFLYGNLKQFAGESFEIIDIESNE